MTNEIIIFLYPQWNLSCLIRWTNWKMGRGAKGETLGSMTKEWMLMLVMLFD